MYRVCQTPSTHIKSLQLDYQEKQMSHFVMVPMEYGLKFEAL